jgi:hypothetical protein
MIYFVVPCGAAKTAHAAPARELYTSATFRHYLRAAEAEAAATTRVGLGEAKVLIMSALHGLVELDTVLDPYDVRIGDTAAITVAELAAQFTSLGIDYDDEVYAMLPKRYLAKLELAGWVHFIPVQNVYEAAPGIGYQRGVASNLLSNLRTPSTASAA